MKTKAILFDLGNTLITAWMLEASFQKILASAGINLSLGEVQEASDKTIDEFAASGYSTAYGKASRRQYWKTWHSSMLKHLGFSDNVKLLEELEAKWHSFVECEAYPEVKEVLSELRRKNLKIGLISSAFEEDVFVILKRAGLRTELFNIIVGADTAESMKPDPEVFRFALRRLSAKPEEALFIGDSVEADYNAAEKAGIRAVLIQRTEKGIGRTRGLKVVASLDEIFRYIR